MAVSKVTYHQSTKTVWRRSELSGHQWPEHIPLKTWEVHGGGFHVTKHRSEAAALREVEEREAFANKWLGGMEGMQ